MKPILFELGFRGLYVILLYTSMALCFYLSAGFQHEYASVLCHSHYQSIDFSYQNHSLPYNNPYYHSSNQILLLSHNDELNFLHQSKSWGLLSLPSVCYFHNWNVDPSMLIWYYKTRVMLVFLAFQWFGFALPGIYKSIRLQWFACVFLIALFLAAVSIAVASFLVIAAELYIEPFDSELLFLHS